MGLKGLPILQDNGKDKGKDNGKDNDKTVTLLGITCPLDRSFEEYVATMGEGGGVTRAST